LAQDTSVTATSELFARVSQTPAVQSMARRVEGGGALSCAGVSPPASPFLAVLLRQLLPRRPIVVVTEGLKTQEIFHQDAETWLKLKSQTRAPASAVGSYQPSTLNSQPLFYPGWEILPHEGKLPHADVISERLETLVALGGHATGGSQEVPLIVTAIAALLQRTFPPDELKERIRTLHRGDRTSPVDLIEWLEDQGYEPEAQVTAKGEIAVRGGILDVYPLTSPWPARLEFFGDELESLRFFDPATQVSREEITAVTLPPGGELGILKRSIQDPGPGIQGLATLLDYLPRETIFLLCEPEELTQRADEYAQQVPANDPFFVAWDEFGRMMAEREVTRVELSESGWKEPPSPSAVESVQSVEMRLESLDVYRPLLERPPEPQVVEAQRREFFAQLHRWRRQGQAVHVFCNNDGERQRFEEIWEENGFGNARPALHLGTLSRGFFCEDAKLVVVTDAEVFGRYKVQRPRRLRSPHALATRSSLDIDFTDLEEGDFVVHLQYGIGRYLGLSVLPIGAGTKPAASASAASAGTECLVIEYAAGDPSQPAPRLYVPVPEAHLVSKYVGAGKSRPPLNTLGGGRWAKTKAQAERAVRDLAAELLAIQAARESQPGHAFGRDMPWQREFESAFVFQETPDQMQAIHETKADMEKAKPMDRLICGDVGFGKTEVAIRAAFKAVLGGRQVAVLVPTTVLAQQHFNTFCERMADYPVRTELLSRFRTRRAQERVVKELAAGAVDIVIGTHRLLQEDIAFKDLGLVVIDEEQRFGVLHKEKFKRLRTLVDVLTLSATPIPRTLYLALTGARDMSTIQTPPHDRLPVETIVTEYDERTIRDAIQRELNRGGQVFFLHNRVLTIDTMAQKLRLLLPHARLVVGHGQMHSDELEEVMTRFVNGEADVLLSTTIIESGLDIPNANTIIIDHADRFGLSDLYQLRGRVGRYKHQAYAYLLLPRHARLLSDARKRISAIKQYATLGSGFKVAMRDLEIRGAGNLLGSEQSGHITAVGFELYCQLLKQSVGSLKGEKVKPRAEVLMRLDFLELNSESAIRDAESDPASATRHMAPIQSAALPRHYVPEPRHRIEIYRKLAQVTEPAALGRFKEELRDRFGALPPSVEMLLQVSELKILASERGVKAVEVNKDKLMLTRHEDYLMLGGKFPRLTSKTARARLKEIKRLLLAL
jgi:transcription-repair coupling factor (superfamily II helicase)